MSKCSCTSFVKIEVEIRVSFMCSITTLSKQYLLGYLYIESIDTVFDIINSFCKVSKFGRKNYYCCKLY